MFCIDFCTFYLHFFWQKIAPSRLDPEGRGVFKLVGQNQAEFAQLAVFLEPMQM